MPVGTRRRVALGLGAVVILGALLFRVARAQCTWGTFAYTVAVQNPTSQEDWRKDAAVLVEGQERLVTRDHAVIDVAISPDGKRIVVAKGRGPTDDEYAGIEPTGLYVLDVDGSDEERLTLESVGSSPDWSPDGETVVFLSGRTIRTVDVDDKEEREVFRLPPADGSDPDYLVDATWSGDSRAIAFVVGSPISGDGALWTMRADGSERRRVSVLPDVNDDLAWFPEGATFAWGGSFGNVPSVLLTDAGDGPRQVEPNSQDPVWSADGDELAYVIGHEGHYAPRIVVGDATGSDERPIPVPDGARGGTSLEDWASC
jgi:Tol biopolymer transport system component